MTARIISFYNQKGGVGKTSTTALVGYNLAKMGFKVLVIDFDPQANITQLYLKTATRNGKVKINTTLMGAVRNNLPLDDIKMKIKDRLYLVPTSSDFYLYPRYIESRYHNEDERVQHMYNMIKDSVIDKFDFIFIDVPPTLGLSNDTAFYACDQVILVLQTQERSLQGARTVRDYLQNMLVDTFDARTDILGILPVLSKHRARVDDEILDAAKDEFGAENVFDNVLYAMERVKRMDMTGITDSPSDSWDIKTHKAYKAVAEEMLARLWKA